jgi:hypothetical protein
MKQAGDIATMMSLCSINLKLGKSLQFIFLAQLRQGDVREGVVNQNTHEVGQCLTLSSCSALLQYNPKPHS